jgi:aspartate/methionine/tyrosine aminotransferase
MTNPPNFQAFYPFTRLNRLLEEIPPGPSPAPDGKPVLLSLGEPRHRPPAFVAEVLAENAEGWSRYPLPRGTPGYRKAAAGWLARRYGLAEEAVAPGGPLDPETAILPLPGSREGLFFAALATLSAARGKGKSKVLLPNPFYHVYMGAALAAGGEPVLMPATAATGHLPDPEALEAAVLDAAALCYFCTPANPQGAVADPAHLGRLIALARKHDFVLAIDECYSEIYTGDPPAGALQAALNPGETPENGPVGGRAGGLDNLLAFHSLSKRSSAPGLRCGFVAGDPRLIGRLDEALRVGGAGVPLPVLAAGERLWRDEAHVAENRALYQEKFAIAERILGGRFGFRLPAGGFFLWLEVGDGEAAAVELWRQGGLKVVPGAYMGADMPDRPNPGKPYIRVALIHDAALVEAALERLAVILTNRKSL